MTAVANGLRTGQSLVAPELFRSIVDFGVTQFGQTRERAERQTDQALAFVAAMADTAAPMVPSDDVDHAFHAFILHTRDYADFCQSHVGRFVHHNPRPGSGGRSLDAVRASAHAMKAAGFVVLDDLWTVNGESAAQCDSDDGRDYAI
ncbi:glycine-rich domain-containing protein [Streptomyces sp. NPDC088923]|uniref:glycine-rich domain-containing protein n=1 Tax=Streptomyces sp. NPDC088923 TaxID=3365913 RepID=UPI0038069416